MKKKETFWGLLFAAPILLGTLVFFAVPFGISVWYSFTFGAGGAEWVGFANYSKIFTSSAFRLAAYNTLRFLGLGVPLIMICSFSIACMLKEQWKGSRFFQSSLLLPMVVPIASIVMVIQLLFSPGGFLNAILEAFGLTPTDWMNTPSAFYILLGMYIWKNCGYNVILLLAGLQMIPKEFYDTADLEGASRFQRLRLITLPLMAPSLFFTFVISIVNSFKSYREAFLLGGTHPHKSIYMLQHFLNNNFQNLNYQRLSIAAILLFLLIFLLVGILYLIQNRWGEVSG